MPTRAESVFVAVLPALAVAMCVACGARTSLTDDDGATGSVGSGGGALATTLASGSGGGAGAGLDCDPNDMTTWSAERYRDDGDYERFAVATSGVPWVALKRRDGNVVIEQIGIDDDAGIIVSDSFELPDSPVYPVALDVSPTRFVVLTTTGINWNGDVALWSVDRETGAVTQVPIGDPPEDPAYTVGSALGLVGDDVVVAYARLIDDQGVLEIRDAALQVQDSRVLDGTSFTPVRRTETELDVYVGANERFRVSGSDVTSEPVDPEWHILGGLGDDLVQYDADIRLIHGDQVWSGPWPHTQISPPAVVRSDGQKAVFSLETELTAVVGYPRGAALEWMEIEPTLDASGLGVGMFPVVEEGRLGLFYLGLEIPNPEQPLRYFGRRCR
ncbi:MAG TPA: hypothetical protein VL400_09740 [Polyangiaceae bacterium]|nr:hypothetical protein [Polyangiaceae bacterium]